MQHAEIAQWAEAIGTWVGAFCSLFVGLVAVSIAIWYEVIIPSRRLREGRSALIKAAVDEALLNEDFARHNAETAKVGGWAFIRQRVSSCIQAFHTGTFDIDEHTRTVVRGYIEGIEHVNSMIRSLELVSLHRPEDASKRALFGAIRRYCGGEMDSKIDVDAKSLPDQIREFRDELETKFKKELV